MVNASENLIRKANPARTTSRFTSSEENQYPGVKSERIPFTSMSTLIFECPSKIKNFGQDPIAGV